MPMLPRRALALGRALILPLIAGCEAITAVSPCTDATWYADDDGDGYGNDATTTKQCFSPDGFASEGGDCDDANASVHPNAADGCDVIDNDCDGETDENPDITWYIDADADGFGNAPVVVCTAPAGSAEVDGDCDDSDASVYPGATELCDTADNDCDGETDEADAADAPEWYIDADDDGVGDDASPLVACDQPDDAVAIPGDCDDTDASVGAAHDWYSDVDGDGYGDAIVATYICSGPADSVGSGGDCNEADASINPGSDEVCDDADNDCSGAIDDSPVDGFEAWLDADGDAYGDPGSHTYVCSGTDGYVANGSDCDDAHAEAHPGGTEICDTFDNDCDGTADWGVRVGTDYVTIQEAIDAAGDGETVCIPAGTYYENLSWSSDVSLDGAGDHVTIIDGGGAGSVLTITGGEASVQHLTIQGGDAAQGAGIYAYDATLEVRYVGIYTNGCSDATCEGTGVYVHGGDVVLFDTIPSSNQQSGTMLNRGAGVYVEDATIWLQGFVANGNVQDTAPTSEGTGIYITGSDAQIYSCDSDNNVLTTAGVVQEARGAGLYIADSSLTVADLYMGDDTVTVDGTTNTVEGGVLFASNSDIEGSSVNVTQASVTSDGGTTMIWGAGAALLGGTYTVEDGTLWRILTSAPSGYATLRGGGVYASDGASLDLTRALIDDNEGAVDEAYGGGVYLASNTWLLATSCNISANVIGKSGALADGAGIWAAGDVTLTNVTMAHNQGEGRYVSGGAFYLEGGSVTGRNIILSENDAAGTIEGEGDFAACDGAGSLTFTYSDLWSGESTYGDCGGSHDFTTGTNMMVEPGFSDTTAPDPGDWDLRLAVGSALIDAGDPSLVDADGSRSDVGGYGGPAGSW